MDSIDILNDYNFEEKSKRYIARPNTWFREGYDCRLIEYLYDHQGKKYGQFEGLYVIGKPENATYDECFWLKIGHKSGDEVLMKTILPYDEFEIS
jgi:hypothetical protein